MEARDDGEAFVRDALAVQGPADLHVEMRELKMQEHGTHRSELQPRGHGFQPPPVRLTRVTPAVVRHPWRTAASDGRPSPASRPNVNAAKLQNSVSGAADSDNKARPPRRHGGAGGPVGQRQCYGAGHDLSSYRLRL